MDDIIKESLLFRHTRISSELQDRVNPANLYDISFGKLASELTELRHALLWRKKYPNEGITQSPYSTMLWSLLEDYEREKNNEWSELNKIKPKNQVEEEEIRYKKNEIEKWLKLIRILKIRH